MYQIMVDIYNITTEKVAKKINIPTAQIYLTLGDELLT
jgi:hypothetical protein